MRGERRRHLRMRARPIVGSKNHVVTDRFLENRADNVALSPARLDGLAANAADNVCFQAAPQGVSGQIWRMLCQVRNKISICGACAKLSVAAERNNLRFGLDGRAKFWHTEFRTALLSYLTEADRLDLAYAVRRSGLCCRGIRVSSRSPQYEGRQWPEARPADRDQRLDARTRNCSIRVFPERQGPRGHGDRGEDDDGADAICDDHAEPAVQTQSGCAERRRAATASTIRAASTMPAASASSPT